MQDAALEVESNIMAAKKLIGDVDRRIEGRIFIIFRPQDR